MTDTPGVINLDFAKTQGRFRLLHGINKGPLGAGGLLDVSEPLRALAIPHIRLHDCHWPVPDVVDMHVVFPNANADPERAENYDFRLTDEYLAAAHAVGAQIIYRLGESIEHTSVKRFVHPPKNAEKWAAAALGVVRHYNEGWANGFRYNIRYWEIWNEPENRPAMWSGTDADYFHLYRVTARKLKARYPDLKIGGPAVGNSGALTQGVFQPSPFVTAFLEFCRKEKLPLDFFSWHCYTADPAELAVRAKGIRRLLDSYGFTHTESHLNEWNYLPDNRWDGATRSAAPAARQKFSERMAGAEGAAFLAAALVKLQDAPVEVGNLFHGEAGSFGIFTEHGVPMKNYYALLAFKELAAAQQRVMLPDTLPAGLEMGAGIAADRQSATVLISHADAQTRTITLALQNLPWKHSIIVDVKRLDAALDLTPIERSQPLGADHRLDLSLKGASVSLITLRPAAQTPPTVP